MIPSIMAVENHDLTIEFIDGKRKRVKNYVLWKNVYTSRKWV